MLRFSLLFLIFVQSVLSHTLTLLNDPHTSPIWDDPINLTPIAVVRGAENRFRLYYNNPLSGNVSTATSINGKNWTSAEDTVPQLQYGMVVHADYYADGFVGINSGDRPNNTVMYYRAWFTTENGSNNYTESPDGIHWYNVKPFTQYGVPFGEPGDGCYMTSFSPWGDVVYTEDAANIGTDWTFRMYFGKTCYPEGVPLRNIRSLKTSRATKVFTNPCEEMNMSIYVAFSENGYNWTAYDATGSGHATPVFEPSYNTSERHDMCMIMSMQVVRNSPTDWEAFYSGVSGVYVEDISSINYATSTDGITWNRSPQNPLISTENTTVWYNFPVYQSVVKTALDHYLVYFVSFITEIVVRENGYAHLGLIEFSSDIPPIVNPPVNNLSTSTKVLIIVLATEGVIVAFLVPILIIFRQMEKKQYDK